MKKFLVLCLLPLVIVGCYNEKTLYFDESFVVIQKGLSDNDFKGNGKYSYVVQYKYGTYIRGLPDQRESYLILYSNKSFDINDRLTMTIEKAEDVIK